jgi:PiT family inorganic phosphate transporter
LAAASTVVVSTSTGIPVSATQTLVGAVFGVGLARGIGALNLTVIRNIFLSWVITIPAAAGLATLFFFILRMIFGS